ncbi:MAG TPA: serine hydrolase domain-containing protein, partial [Longimicrobium sp.]|nr:serine hydrolase domain-containing protein [Longimicrobium sp.]
MLPTIRLSRFAAVLAAIAVSSSPAPLRGQHAHHPGAPLLADSLVRAAVAEGRAAGAVVVVQRGSEAPITRAYGLADVENAVPMTAEHVFPIASVTKQFTAAAVLQLVEQGKVELDEPITTYLPDAPTQGARITVRHLLTHTAGLQDVTEVPGFRSVERLDLTPDSTIALVRNAPLHFAPGEQMRYSNTGYLLLGRLIEVVSGKSYEEYLSQHLFRPAGMRSSRYCDQRALIPHRASGYELAPEGLVRPRFISLRIPYAAGGICATAGDLAAWNRALHDGRILRPGSLVEMARPGKLRSGRRTRYGMGLAVGTLAGHPARHHGGDIQGFTSYSAYFPHDSLSVVVLVNTQGPARPDAIVEQIAAGLLGQAPTPAGSPGREHAPAADLASFVGEYGDGVRVTAATGGLHLAGSPQGDAD